VTAFGGAEDSSTSHHKFIDRCKHIKKTINNWSLYTIAKNILLIVALTRASRLEFVLYTGHLHTCCWQGEAPTHFHSRGRENVVSMMIVHYMMGCVYLNMIQLDLLAVHHHDAVQNSYLKIMWNLLSAISTR
jgi:hypothetical protein